MPIDLGVKQMVTQSGEGSGDDPPVLGPKQRT